MGLLHYADLFGKHNIHVTLKLFPTIRFQSLTLYVYISLKGLDEPLVYNLFVSWKGILNIFCSETGNEELRISGSEQFMCIMPGE